MSDWPELGEELARKSLEKLEEALQRHARGKITRRELFLVTDALYDASIGLIDKEASNAIYAVRQGVRNGTV